MRSDLKIIKISRELINYIICKYHKTIKSSKTFVFQGNVYSYFCHQYNNSWKNERIVEIPIIWNMVKEYEGKRILEVGNVLSNYFPVSHDILDKYDRAEGVINQDVVDFKPSMKYDLIVSISTLEHVGWDEEPKDDNKILCAIENLKSCLASKGKMVVTLPLGHNPVLDKLLKEGKIPFTEFYYLRRNPADEWNEVDWKDIIDIKYDYKPYPAARGLVIGIVNKSAAIYDAPL